MALTAALKPGEVLHYEIETDTTYSADILKGYSTTAPLGPCLYSLAGELTLLVEPAGADGNFPVQAEYRDLKVTNWNCHQLSRASLESRLRNFAASKIVYQVGPRGEVGFEHNSRDRFTYLSAADLLSRVTQDLLQSRLADRPKSLGSSWKPNGQFTYWKDYLLSGLDLSAATMRWKSTPKIAGQDCAWITSKYVFAPTESWSGAITPGGTVRHEPTNVVAGVLDVSLLFDLRSHHIAWLNRSYRVENHVGAEAEIGDDPDVLTVRWVEEGKARLIAARNSMEWMAALKTFESNPEPSTAPAVAGTEPSMAELAKAAVHKKWSVSSEKDTLDFTPQNFSRWERNFCDGSWFCAEVSVALPGDVKIAEDATLRTVYLARTPDTVITVTVGPALQRKHQGLTPDEELQKQSEYFLANRLWMMNKPGISMEAQSTSVDGYPARLTAFRGSRRDLASIQGKLAVLLSPWGESYPVTCNVEQGGAAALDETCDRILGLVLLRRSE
jgi:hypothetical protein